MSTAKLTAPTKSRPQILVETRQLEELVAYPRQAKIFPDMSDAELETLAEDIRRNGLKQAIEILPNNKCGLPPNTILNGHQRKRALELLGKREVRVRVRYDLAQKSKENIEHVFLSENFARRQLSKLAQCYVAKVLVSLEKCQTPQDRAADEAARVRDRVGKKVGMSGRHLDRYLTALKAPRPVQEAYGRGEITLNDVLDVTTLPQNQQQEIAKGIQSGKPPKPMIRKFKSRPQLRARKPNVSDFPEVVRTIAALTQTEPQLGRMSAATAKQLKSILTRCSKTIADWIKKIERDL